MELKETKFYKFLERFMKENGRELKSSYDIRHGNDLPFDSVDRIYALYLIDIDSKLLKTDISDIEKLNGESLKKLLTKEEMEEYKAVTYYAYDNYEREGMSDYEAFYNLLFVAKQGKDKVLKDSYDNGGWFGAS